MKGLRNTADWRWYCRHVALASAILLGSLAAQAAPARGATDRPVEVTVKCKALADKSQVELNVLQVVSPGGMQRKLPIKAEFNAQGECKVGLPAGQYRFEVLYLDKPATLVALKTALREFKTAAVVDLPTLPPQPVEFSLSDRVDVPLSEFAIRSEAAPGEIVWHAGREGPRLPTVIASPNQRYRVRVMGENDTTHIALWHEVPAATWSLRAARTNVYTCRFRLRTDGPPTRRVSGVMAFPDGKMEFPLTAKTVFLTNRRFLSFGYRLDLKNGRRVVMHPQLGDIRKSQTFVIGGPLTPCAWGTVMKRCPIGKPTTEHLVCDADLCDPQGCLVNHRESIIAWEVSVETPWGPVGRDVQLTPSQVEALKNPSQSVLIAASYCLDKPASVKLAPVGFRDYSVLAFKTSAPPHWGVQAVNYLAKARRVFHCIEEYEGKPCKHGLEIHWHNLAGIGWGGGSSITMPFDQLGENFDQYANPWALTHEVLHTFGYPHGERMTQANIAVDQKLECFRWYMADHPALNPGPAFDLFLVFQRGS